MSSNGSTPLREALQRIIDQDKRFMDYRRVDEWDIRCYVCGAYSTNESIDGHYQMVFHHKADCPIEIAKAAINSQEKTA